MKNNKIIKGMMLLASASMLTACSDSYLEVAPESEPSPSVISTSLSGAQLAIRGIGRAMNCQYSELPGNQPNGESYINTIFGEGWGQDCYESLAMQQFGASGIKWNRMGDARNSTWENAVIWNYPYQLIYMANGVLDGIAGMDATMAETAEAKFYKAQALTFRAHAYVKLMQYFAPRWEDSNNGATPCIVIRTTQSLEDQPLSSMADVKKRIYDDLDEAIKLYDESKLERQYKWEADKSVALGVYARAAMICHDWATAQKMAHDAQEGYEVMDNNTLFQGFYKTNNDFMWESSAEESDIYYWSWGSHYTVNGQYVNSWANIGAGSISLDLYNQMDPKDVRRSMFLTPDKVTEYRNLSPNKKLKADDFWDATLVNASNMDMSIGATGGDRSKPDLKWGLVNFIVKYGQNYRDKIFTGSLAETNPESGNVFTCYFEEGSAVEGGFAVSKGVQAKLTGLQIGAQYKFWSIRPYGVSTYPYMRSTEMLLTEAEAAYMAGDMPTATNCLVKIQGLRIPGYTCTKTGQDLLNEIRLARRLELWGEGYGFPDLKRWNLPIERRAWVANDPASGNCAKQYSMKRQPNEQAGWRFMIPASETDFNKAIDRTQLPDQSQYTTVE